MPTYEYKCESCTHQFEVFARMSDPDPEICEACGEHTLQKVLFPVAVHYKGSGFYSTDYSGTKSSTSGDAPSSTKDTGSSGSESSSSASGSSDSSSSSTSSESSGSSSGGSSNDG